MTRTFTILFLAAVVVGCGSQSSPSPTPDEGAGPLTLPSTNVVDLSHSFNAETIYWPTEEGFRRTSTAQGVTERGYYYSAGTFTSAEHGGTHIDAPSHFWEGGSSVDAIPLSRLMGPAVVIDVTDHVGANPDYRVTEEDIRSWESERRPIPDGSIVLIRTGFGAYWPDRGRYLGTSDTGPEAVAELQFPGLHPDAASWLLENRNIQAIGIDTPSIDYGQSQLFETHQILFERGVPALENLANLGQLPVEGAIVIALPMKIEGGSGAPIRAIAFTP